MSGIFDKLHHICIVAHDAERTAAFYESIGIGPWRDYPPLADYAELDVPDPAGFRGLTFKVATLGTVQLQLCQPGPEDGPQRRHLERHGEGVFHLGFDVPDCDAGERLGLDNGLAVSMKGRRSDRSGFTFFDTASAAGVVLEIRSSAAPMPAPASKP